MIVKQVKHLNEYEGYLLELSKPRGKLLDSVNYHSYQLLLHLAKLYVFPWDIQNREHWYKEVANFVNKLPTLKGKHNLPKKSDLERQMKLKNKNDESGRDAKSLIAHLKIKYPRTSYEDDAVVLQKKIDSYVDELSDVLSKSRDTSNSQVKALLNRVGLITDAERIAFKD